MTLTFQVGIHLRHTEDAPPGFEPRTSDHQGSWATLPGTGTCTCHGKKANMTMVKRIMS